MAVAAKQHGLTYCLSELVCNETLVETAINQRTPLLGVRQSSLAAEKAKTTW